MPISAYLKTLREKVGHATVLMPSVSAVVFDEAGRLLLVRNMDDGLWSTPGGSVDPNESPADAAVREMWEETGLLVEPVRLLGVYGGPDFVVTYPNGDRLSFVNSVFVCRIIGGSPRPDGEEIAEIRYFTQDEVFQLAMPAWTRSVKPDLFTTQEKAYFTPPGWRPPE